MPVYYSLTIMRYLHIQCIMQKTLELRIHTMTAPIMVRERGWPTAWLELHI